MKITPEQLKRLANEQHAEITRLREENARLWELLKPFVDVGDEYARWWAVPSAYLRAVRAAIREGGKDE